MRREDLARILQAASLISGDTDVVVIGSQAILGSYAEAELPELATISREADVAFWADEDNVKSDAVDGAIGEQSEFDEKWDYYAQGVSIDTAILPDGWRDRLVAFKPVEAGQVTGWCLEPHDLALSKLAAHREKDRDFVEALIDHKLLDPNLLRERVPSMPISSAVRGRLDNWIKYHSSAN